MSKTETHRQELKPLFDSLLTAHRSEALIEYLVAESQDRDVLWILHQNLKTNRLVRGFLDQVKRLTRPVTSET